MDCKDCKHVPRIDKQLEELTKFKDRMTNGTISRIWEGIEAKVSKSIIVTVLVVMVTFVGTLFSLAFANAQKKNQCKTFNNAPGYSSKKSYPEAHFLEIEYTKWLILFKLYETNKNQKNRTVRI